MNRDNLLKLAFEYQEACNASLMKIAIIQRLPNSKYRVMSETGKNLGTYKSKDAAKNRLKQVEFFKHIEDNNKAEDEAKSIIDLSEVEELSYSALLRKLRKNAPKECVMEFLKIYNNQFNRAVKKNLQKPEAIAMQNALILFNKKHKIKMNLNIIKNAAVTELGDPRLVGKYLADIIRFTLTRIDLEKRPNALNSLKSKIYALNEMEISNKNLPPSSAIGQSITFVKHVLLGHNPIYIREVINNVVRNL